MVKQDKKKAVEEVLEELFPLLQISAQPAIEEREDEIEVSLETEDTGVIIGYHGEVLEGLQLLLSLMVSKKIGTYHRILLEVGDYRKKRTEYLQKLAAQAKERALADQSEVILSDLKPWERRIIHVLFTDDKEVQSESQGEGKERALIIKPRAK